MRARTFQPRLETLDDRDLPSGAVPTDPVAYTPDTPFKLENYYIDVPSSYDPSNQTPITLFVWSHGCGGYSQFDIYDYNWSPGNTPYITIALDTREGGCWNMNADPAVILAAIADVKTHFNIEATRVILGGYSSGGDLSYRVAFTASQQIAGVIAENTAPFRDTGLTPSQALAAPFKFNVVHLAHTEDTTYPIDTVRSETTAVANAGFPLVLIEKPGDHYNDRGTPGDTVGDYVNFALPYINADWTSPGIVGNPGPGGGTTDPVFGSVVGGNPGSPRAILFGRDGVELRTVTAFGPGFEGGVRVASGDVNGDGVPDLIAGAGPGGGLVVVIDGASGSTLATLDPFGGFGGGVFVAAGDLNLDGKVDLVVTPDQGGGPSVVVYDGASVASGGAAELARFFGIQDDFFRGGARAAIGDVTADGVPDLIIAAGFLGGPRITIWGGTAVLAGRTTAGDSPLANFFAFEDTLRNGCFVAVGDLNGDGKVELVFAGGPGGGPRNRLADAAEVLAAGGFGSLDRLPSSDRGTFFAGNPDSRGGVRIAVRDVAGVPTLLVGSGEGLLSERRSYVGSRVVGLTSTSDVAGDTTLDPFGSVLTDGIFVG